MLLYVRILSGRKEQRKERKKGWKKAKKGERERKKRKRKERKEADLNLGRFFPLPKFTSSFCIHSP